MRLYSNSFYSVVTHLYMYSDDDDDDDDDDGYRHVSVVRRSRRRCVGVYSKLTVELRLVSF
jgi:hypothetical protein